MAGLMPCGRIPGSDQQLISLFWSFKNKMLSEFQNEKYTLDDWKELLSHYWSKLISFLDTITSKDQIVFGRYNDVRMDSYHKDNVLYIGDCAHGTSPQLGQGANLAVIDAFMLSQVLNIPDISVENVSEMLKIYEKLRKSHVSYLPG
jgi:2-polyprenyl-6-methoxyphenol hydroxylase-like FAD-dependent oxidoreductase